MSLLEIQATSAPYPLLAQLLLGTVRRDSLHSHHRGLKQTYSSQTTVTTVGVCIPCGSAAWLAFG